MALDLTTFRTRTLTAAVFVVVMLGGLLFHALAFRLLVAMIMAGCSYEWLELQRRIHQRRFPPQILWMPVYLFFPLLMLYDLGAYAAPVSVRYDPLYPCALLFSIWINDTLAYLIGSMVGKTPLSSLSPKKTWEGTLGGVLATPLVMALLGYAVSSAHRHSPFQWGMLALLAAVSGTLGDLYESGIKRRAGVKDSGSIMPGHGGFLDRFDSLLFAAPVVWVYVRFYLHPTG